MKNRNLVTGAFATILLASASSSAIAGCTGGTLFALSGGNALGTFNAPATNLAAFSAGGALNTLISSINTANTAFLTQSTAFVGAPGNPRPNQEGGGIWARGIGGEIDTKNSSTSTYQVTTVAPNAPTNFTTAPFQCETSTNLKFAGTQVGTDMARLNWNGWNVHVGSMAGYLGARARDTSAPGVLDPAGGTLVNNLEVPFVGMYAAATYGGLFIDGQIRWDFYQNRLNDFQGSGLIDQRLDARGLAFTGNIGYNHQLGNGWFIEPSAGVVVSRVEVDPLNTSGTLVYLNLLGPGAFVPPATVQINDIKSTLGRFSIRTGTTIVSDKVIWQPFVTASVFHEFQGNVTTNMISSFGFAGVPGINISGTTSTNGIGTYGQFAAGVAGQLVGTGWLGYLRADYRTGERIEGYSLNGGLRYQFSPDPPAMAPKGLIGKSPPLAVAAAYNWTGFYIGGHFGALYGWTDVDFPGGFNTDPRFAGALAGGQAGYDHQIGKWVIGVEGTGSWTNAKGARGCPGGLAFFYNCEIDLDWFATGTARLGYAYWDRAIIYAKGGVAAAEVQGTVRCNTSTQPLILVALPNCNVPVGGVAATGVTSASRTMVGWTIGWGTEFALDKNWTVKGETNYFDLGKETFTNRLGTAEVKVSGINATIGLNYRFWTGGR
jgi:opacity protein-like surface antigen